MQRRRRRFLRQLRRSSDPIARRMGWTDAGRDHHERADDEWYTEVKAMLAALPDDTFLTLLDCHI